MHVDLRRHLDLECAPCSAKAENLGLHSCCNCVLAAKVKSDAADVCRAGLRASLKAHDCTDPEAQSMIKGYILACSRETCDSKCRRSNSAALRFSGQALEVLDVILDEVDTDTDDDTVILHSFHCSLTGGHVDWTGGHMGH